MALPKKYLDNSNLAEVINLSNGQILNASFIHKFGATPSMSVNTTGTIWDVNDTIYPWSVWDTPGVIAIPAVNVSDNAKKVTVYGLNEFYEPIDESFTLSSSGTVTGIKTFSRIFRAYYYGNITNIGDINIQRSGTTIGRITAGKAQTLMSVYTIPSDYTGYLMQGIASIQYGGDATIDMFIRYYGQQSFRIGHSGEVAGTGMPYKYGFSIPIPIPERSDIDIRANVRSNNSRVTAAFDIILIRNP